jgi:hypothetical protein
MQSFIQSIDIKGKVNGSKLITFTNSYQHEELIRSLQSCHPDKTFHTLNI